MNKVELTPAKLAELKRWIKLAQESNWVSKLGLCGRAWIQDEYDLVNLRDCFPDEFENDDQGKAYSDAICVLEFIAAADPATVLAMVEEIEQLRRMERKWGQLLKNVKDTAPDLETFLSPDAFKLKESETGQ